MNKLTLIKETGKGEGEMTTFGFVRHGVTEWNKIGRAQGKTDVPLDEEGIEMARLVSNRLKKEHWDVIYTSPLIRAKRTAEIIAENQRELPFIIDERLGEIGGGLVEGTTEEERVERWGRDWRSLDMGFESAEDIISRGLGFMEDVKKEYPDKRVLVVSHGGFISRLLGALIPEEDFSEDIGNTSLTIVEIKEQQSKCTLFNCMNHLKLEKVD